MFRNRRPPLRRLTLRRFELGDRVLVQPDGREGIVIGVRYGEMAYDVRCAGACLRNVAPQLIRVAQPRLSEVA
jgi:hypothetical protein